METEQTQPDWPLLEGGKRSLLDTLQDDGVTRVEFVVGFMPPFTFWVWLGAETDSERDALSAHPDLLLRIRETLTRSGIEGALVEGVTAESQETVDRDFEGSWFYRLR